MITKENGLRYAKLIHVSVDNGKTDNSNKVYIMEELSDGRIKCEYGRVGKNMSVREAGVLAQQVNAVLPEAVSVRADGYMAVQYEKMVPLLIEAIKELKAEIDQLKKTA